MTFLAVLKETNIKDLFRALNSEKSYLSFKISVFNVGANIKVICTDTYKEINRNNWNGYDFRFENDKTTKYYIISTLEEIYKESPEKFTKKQIKELFKN